MKNVIRRYLRLATIVIALAVSASAATFQRAPDLVLKDVRGRSVRLEDYKHKIVLINFWATWCAPCRAEIPGLIKWQRRYGTRGLRILGVTYPPERPREVRQFARKLRLNYPVALGTKKTKLLFTESETLPVTVVIDGDRNVREVIEGIIFPDEFEQKIKPLLAWKSTKSKQRLPFRRP